MGVYGKFPYFGIFLQFGIMEIQIRVITNFQDFFVRLQNFIQHPALMLVHVCDMYVTSSESIATSM
jgi:hypothetical protein